MASPVSPGPTSPSKPVDTLLGTKLHVRPPRPGLVSRRRLLELLDQGFAYPLTLVSAPAGFGKTTLLAEWLSKRPRKACWLSLEAADNDPPRFLSYLIAALQTVVPGLAGDLASPLRSLQPPSVEAVTAALANELASVPGDLTLVLDDYHVVTSPEVSGALAHLLESLPPNVHLVIATRSDPPLPIARLRARGQMVEVRADSLRFTPDEAAAFLGQTMGLTLSPEQVSTLDERTEGWIAGLQMAALSMRGRTDVDGFIQAFAGTNRYILDFLVEEVLSREPEEVQTFLLQSSILDRLSGSLCDAVRERTDSQKMLEQLERANLFLVALDDDRQWYRYHHLFADLLRARLQQALPDRVPELYARAAHWCEQEGLIAEAIGYYLDAHEYDRAAQLAERAYLAIWARSDTVSGRVTEFPDAVVRRRPWLSTYRATLLVVRGQPAQADDYARAAEELLRSGLTVPDDRDLASYLAALRAYIAEWRERDRRAVETAREALSVIGEDKPAARNTVGYWLGISLYLRGDLTAAEEVLTRLARRDRQTTVTNIISPALTKVLKLQIEQGRLREAARLSEGWLSWMDQSGRWRYYMPGNLSIMLAEVLRQWDDLGNAASRVREGIEENRVWANPHFSAAGYCALARVLAAQNDLEGAADALRQLEPLIRGHTLIPDVQSELTACQVALALARGDPVLASVVASESGLEGDLPCDFRHELDRLTQARVLIARGEHERALSLLAEQEAHAREGRRFGRLVEILVLRAKALEASDVNARELALSSLAEALTLAEPEGYVRVFVDEGEPIARLLADLRRSTTRAASDRFSAGYVTRLLAAFEPSQPRPSAQAAAPSPPPPPPRARLPQPLAEPISERELEVLGLMAEGLTNEQIAHRLIIALGTVKAHVHNITGKLGAQNRAQAVARARELDLL